VWQNGDGAANRAELDDKLTISDSTLPQGMRAALHHAPRVELRGGPAWAEEEDYSRRPRSESQPAGDRPTASRDTDDGREGFSGNRTKADFERARRHSRIVAFLKIGLPASAVLTMIAIVAALVFSGGNLPSVGIGGIKIENGKLVMDNPKLNGTDSNQRPYTLTARKAIQDAANPSRITLEKIDARLPLSETSFATVTAGTGIYDADGKTLRLGDKVAVDTQDGMSVRLQDAAIDIASGTLSTQNPVNVDTGRVFLSADTLTVEDKGDRIIFQDRVHMTIRPAGESEGSGAIAIPTMPIVGEISSQDHASSPGKAAE
jgi:lipopolysaccharide export system protein LptC